MSKNQTRKWNYKTVLETRWEENPLRGQNLRGLNSTKVDKGRKKTSGLIQHIIQNSKQNQNN